MTFRDLVRAVLDQLRAAAIPYMVTGSVASSYYGEPRATRDLDVVIEPTARSLENLIATLLAGGFYVDRDAALEAMARRTQFNAIGPDGLKVDFVIRKDRPFSIQEFERRRPADLLGVAGFLPTIEDLILAKLEWASESGSDVQLRDVIGMLAVGENIDYAHLTAWIKALRLDAVWRRVKH
jgi:hypothetical protein